MKLLSPQQVKDSKASEMARELLRSQEIEKAAAKSRKSLANAEADFSQMLAGQQARWAREEKEHAEWMDKTTREVDILETRRARAMAPIELIEKRANDRLTEANELMLQVKNREDQAEETAALLQDKLDAVGQREQDVMVAERAVMVDQQNLAMEKDLWLQRNAALAKARDDFKAHMAEGMKAIRDGEVAVTLRERSLDARAMRLENTEKELEALAIRLKDKEGVLDRRVIRMENKANKA